MNRARPALLSAATALALLFNASIARADSPEAKVVGTLVKSVRYNADAKALQQIAGEEQGAILLGDDWAKGTEAQRTQFVTLFHALFAGIAFPKLRDNLQNLGTTLFEEPKVAGNKAEMVSTIVIDHPLKKQEYRIQWALVKAKDGWKVVDMTVLGVGGNSMLTDIRNDQIVPIMAQGGWPHLLQAMQTRLDSLKK